MKNMEQLSGQSNAEETININSNYELFSNTIVENTPFNIITDNEDKLHFGVMGKHRITEKSENYEQIEKELKEITWDKIIQVIGIMTNMKL